MEKILVNEIGGGQEMVNSQQSQPMPQQTNMGQQDNQQQVNFMKNVIQYIKYSYPMLQKINKTVDYIGQTMQYQQKRQQY